MRGSRSFQPVFVVVVLLASCAPARPPVLEDAETRLQQARLDPLYGEPLAQRELNDAQVDLDQAEYAWRTRRDFDETQRLSRSVEQKIQIANLRARQELAAPQQQRLAETGAAARAEARARLGPVPPPAGSFSLAEELAPFRARFTSAGLELTLSDGMFQPGQPFLRPGIASGLSPLVRYIQARPETTVIIEGHDDTGTYPESQARSLARAEAVRNEMVMSGVAPDRLITRGLADATPVSTDETAARSAVNRRVDVLVQER